MPREFTKLMTARFLFHFATQIQAVVLGWQMYLLTKDPLYLGLIGLAEAVPALGLALYAGYIVDSRNPVSLFRRMLEINLASGLILLLSQLSMLDFDGHTKIIALFLSSFLTGAARAFSQPTVFAIVPRIVERENLSRSSAWMATTMQTARILGPAAGGLLFAWHGIVLSSVVVCVMIVAAVFAAPSFTLAAENKQTDAVSLKENLLSGLKFVFGHPILLPALSLDMISVLFGGVTALLPIYAAEILFIGPLGLGALRAAPALGAALTSYGLTGFDIRGRAGYYLFWAVSGFGVTTLVFAVSQNYIVSIIALGLSGAFDSVSMIIRSSAVQLSSPNSMRGRISAVNSIFIGSSNELGEFESGVLASFIGAMPAAIVGALACIATVGITAWYSPRLRKMNLNELKDEGIAAEPA